MAAETFTIRKSIVYGACALFVVSCISIGLGAWYGRDASIETATVAAVKQTKPEPTTPSKQDPATKESPATTQAPAATTQAPAATTQAPSPDFPDGTEPWKNLRLPCYTVAHHYDLTLYPDFYGNSSTFYGNVTIEIEVKQANYYLLVHIKDLNVTVESVVDKDSLFDYGVDSQWGYLPNQFWITKTVHPINESSTVLLTIRFEGSLTNGIVGFYKAMYENEQAMATSKFEPVDARKAFPCFDEPNLKATYTTKLIHRQGYTALSNMPVKTTSPWSWDTQLNITEFEKSVPMSTYLACFIVCDCIKESKPLKSGKLFTVYAVKGREGQLDYALDLGVNVTDFFEDYFGLDYPLPKQDMIGIPNFVSGAMEHWGLITYRETNLLYKNGSSSPGNRQRVAEVITHELAHQWFGNIVTMDWWDDLWLNEGFATFMAYVGVDEVEPDIQMFSQFAAVEVFTVMPEDSVASSHPIIVPVFRPEEITAVFDSISYNKGASVIRMLEAFVGKELFKKGLNDYLKRYRYDNAKTYQLWQSISEAVEKSNMFASLNVERIMDTWTKQQGFPLITIQYDNTSRTFTASQQVMKSVHDSSQWPESPFSYKWEVPLHYISSSSSNSPTDIKWIHLQNDTIDFESPVNLSLPDQWIKFNKEATGYYVVNYPEQMWASLSEILSKNISVMSPADRSSLGHDSLFLAEYGHLNYTAALNFLQYMYSETEYVPWTSVSGGMFYIRDHLDNPKLWKEFVVNLTKVAYDKLAWKSPETHLEKLLSDTIVRFSCGHEYKNCLDEAEMKFSQWLANPDDQSISVTERANVFIYGMTNITEQDWDSTWNIYMNETLASRKSEIRRGLARTKSSVLINRYLSYALDENKVADQDFFSVISYLGQNPVALPITWDWVKRHYTDLTKRFGLENRSFGRMVPYLVDSFTTADRLVEVEEFFVQNPEAGAGERARKQAVEAIQSSIDWKSRYSSTITEWLSKL